MKEQTFFSIMIPTVKRQFCIIMLMKASAKTFQPAFSSSWVDSRVFKSQMTHTAL